MRTPMTARMRPLPPRTPGTPMSPAKVSTHGRKAPATMAAPATVPVSPAAIRQPPSRDAAGREPARVVMLIMVTPWGVAKAGRWRGRAPDAGPGRVDVQPRPGPGLTGACEGLVRLPVL